MSDTPRSPQKGEYPTGTLGALIEEMGEREAYSHIVAYNIKLRMALAEIADWSSEAAARHGYVGVQEYAKAVLDGA